MQENFLYGVSLSSLVLSDGAQPWTEPSRSKSMLGSGAVTHFTLHPPSSRTEPNRTEKAL